MFKNKKHIILTLIFTVLALAINTFIIVHACLDADASSQSSNNVAEVVEYVVETVSPGTITEANHDAFVNFIRKAFGHFGLFLISGVLTPIAINYWTLTYRKYRDQILIGISVGFGLFLAMLTEIIQTRVPGRSGEFLDVIIDLSGFVLGFVIVFVIIFSINRKKKQEEFELEKKKLEEDID